MAQRLKYPWDKLNAQGDFVVIPEVTPSQIRTSVVAYLHRRFGQEVLCTTQKIPGGTYVALIWRPEELALESTKDGPFPDDPDAEIAEYLDD